MAFKQILALAGVMVTADTASPTNCAFESVAGAHPPPVAVRVRFAVPTNPIGGVQVALRVVAFGLKVPPASLVHVPVMADPPMLPPKELEDPAPQIGDVAGPAFAVGDGITVNIPSNEGVAPLLFVNNAR